MTDAEQEQEWLEDILHQAKWLHRHFSAHPRASVRGTVTPHLTKVIRELENSIPLVKGEPIERPANQSSFHAFREPQPTSDGEGSN